MGSTFYLPGEVVTDKTLWTFRKQFDSASALNSIKFYTGADYDVDTVICVKIICIVINSFSEDIYQKWGAHKSEGVYLFIGGKLL